MRDESWKLAMYYAVVDSVDLIIKRIDKCNTANDMLLVDEAYATLDDFVRLLAARLYDEGYNVTERDLLWKMDQKKDEYLTAFGMKEYDLLEKKNDNGA